MIEKEEKRAKNERKTVIFSQFKNVYWTFFSISFFFWIFYRKYFPTKYWNIDWLRTVKYLNHVENKICISCIVSYDADRVPNNFFPFCLYLCPWTYVIYILFLFVCSCSFIVKKLFSIRLDWQRCEKKGRKMWWN